jgi:hypothetical protein
MKGALIFAINNGTIDYLSMARWSAKNIARHLGIPTAIVTNESFSPLDHERIVHIIPQGTNSRWFGDYNTSVIWHNESRVNAYELTPWDETIVLDGDYVVASDQLKIIVDADVDFIAPRWAVDITGLNDFADLNYFGSNRMPMWWATIMKFRKSQQAKLIFDCMTMVQNNWNHYRLLYKNTQQAYRNDHSLTIALGIVNGHTLDHAGIPWSLLSLLPEHKLTQINPDTYRIDYQTPDNKSKWIQVSNQDFHAMGKQQLGEIVAKDLG